MIFSAPRRPDDPGDCLTGNIQNPWCDMQYVVTQRVSPAQSSSGIVAFFRFAAASVVLLVKLASPSPESRDGR